MLQILIACILFLISYALWIRYRYLQIRGKYGIPGPPTNIILGNLKQIGEARMKNIPMYEMTEKWKNEYGLVYGYYLGARNLHVVVHDLDMVREVLVKQFYNFTDRIHFWMARDPPMSETLINLKGSVWKNVRSALTPTFTNSKIKQMAHSIDLKLDVFMKNMGKRAAKGDTFNIYDNFQTLTLDVIGHCAFGMSVDCQNNSNDPFYIHCTNFFKEADFEKLKLLHFVILFPEMDIIMNQFKRYTRYGKTEKWLNDGLYDVAQRRKDAFKTSQSSDMLQLLVERCTDLKQANNETVNQHYELTMSEIVANCFVFLLGGYETTSTALAFTAWLLAKHQHVQEKLFQEIQTTNNLPDALSYDNVMKLTYLDAVFHESLRIFPPVVGFVARTCVEECQVGDYRIPYDTEVHIPVYNIHHDPEVWPEPDQYKPERFLGNHNRHAMSWIPFGGGPRNCIGLRFAEMEYKLTLTRLIQGYKLVLTDQSEDPLMIGQTNVVLRPANGVRIKLEKR